MNNHGSTSLEAIAGLILLLSTLGLTAQTARVVTAKIWLDHCLYEALICVAEDQQQAVCKNLALKKATRLPLGTEKVTLKIKKIGTQWQGEFQWQGQLGLKARNQMKLDLRS